MYRNDDATVDDGSFPVTSRWDFKHEDDPSRHLRMTIGFRYWRTDTRIASRSLRTDWKVARIDKHASAPSGAPPTYTYTRTHKDTCVPKLVLRRHAYTRARCTITISRDVTAA